MYGTAEQCSRESIYVSRPASNPLSSSRRIVLTFGPGTYIDGQAMWILPEYRSLHAAPLLAGKYEAILDEFDVEGYAECVELSRGTLERAGSILLNIINFPMQIENPSEESKDLMDDFLSESLFLMWRPKKSDKNKEVARPSLGLRESKL